MISYTKKQTFKSERLFLLLSPEKNTIKKYLTKVPRLWQKRKGTSLKVKTEAVDVLHSCKTKVKNTFTF